VPGNVTLRKPTARVRLPSEQETRSEETAEKMVNTKRGKKKRRSHRLGRSKKNLAEALPGRPRPSWDN